ncbi:MAG: hypothetical protein ABSF81_16390 [Bacteroidales bacterium]
MKIWSKENNQLLLLLLLTFLSVYLLPKVANLFIFLVFLVIAYRSKADYLWLTWFFIINDAPGLLFSAGKLGDLRIPLYHIGPGISISFQDLFLFVYILKAIFSRKYFSFVFKKEFTMFYLVGVVLFLYSILLGMSAEIYLHLIRAVLPWAWVMIVPCFIDSQEQMIKVSRLLFPFVFLALASQIYTYITGSYWDKLLRGVESGFVKVTENGEASRSASAVYITFFIFVQSFFFFLWKNRIFSKYYLATIIFTALLTIFLTATRGWIIAFFFIGMGAVLFLSGNRIFKQTVRIVTIALLILLALQYYFPIVKRQIKLSYERVSTLETLAEGDITAGGTVSRISERGPRVMSKVWESPLIGWGFSTDYYQFADGHVGNQTIMLNVGILGYLYLTGLLFYFCYKIWVLSKKSYFNLKYGTASRIYLLGLLAVFIIHSSSSQFWGYDMGYDPLQKTIFFSFLFSAISIIFQMDNESIQFI